MCIRDRSCTASAPGTYIVTIHGTNGTLSHTSTVPYSVPQPDFTISANPASVDVIAGTAATSTVTVAPASGFTGIVTLTSSVSPPGLPCTLTPSTFSLAGSQTSTLSCTPSMIGTFRVTIDGKSGTLSHNATITFISHDFVLSANPSSVPPVLAGVLVSSLVTVTGRNGYSGTVVLSVTSSTGQCSLSPSSVVISSSVDSTLSCSFASAGNFTVTVKGTSGSESNTLQVGFSVQDFVVSANHSAVSLVQGSNENISLTVAGLNGFNQLVRVSFGPHVGLTVTPITTSFVAPGTVVFSFAGDSVGVFNVNITVTSASLSHSVVVQLKVTALPGGASTLFGLAPSLFYPLLALVGVLVAGGVVVAVRGRRRSRVVPRVQAKGSRGRKGE